MDSLVHRPRTAAMPGPPFVLEPGQSDVFSTEPVRRVFRPHRMVIPTTYSYPEIVYLQRSMNVGGSRRKGRRASLLWSAECLKHYGREQRGLLCVDNVTVGVMSQTVRGVSIPARAFAPDVPSANLSMDPARDGVAIRVALANRESCRKVAGYFTFFGVTL